MLVFIFGEKNKLWASSRGLISKSKMEMQTLVKIMVLFYLIIYLGRYLSSSEFGTITLEMQDIALQLFNFN